MSYQQPPQVQGNPQVPGGGFVSQRNAMFGSPNAKGQQGPPQNGTMFNRGGMAQGAANMGPGNIPVQQNGMRQMFGQPSYGKGQQQMPQVWRPQQQNPGLLQNPLQNLPGSNAAGAKPSTNPWANMSLLQMRNMTNG